MKKKNQAPSGSEVKKASDLVAGTAAPAPKKKKAAPVVEAVVEEPVAEEAPAAEPVAAEEPTPPVTW